MISFIMFDLPISDPIFDTERRNMSYTRGPLYALSSTGKVKTWYAEVFKPATINVTHGYIDGKQQVASKDILSGKNIGKANETTPWEQAILEVDSKAQKKIDEGYNKDRSNLTVPILPMLALPFTKRKHNINWPAVVQPKIDGVRCTCTLQNNKLIMFTRKGKEFTAMPHLIQDLMLFLTRVTTDHPKLYLDGELYSDTLTFQELAGTVRRESNDLEYLKQIHYRLFDCFDLDDPYWGFSSRWKHIKDAYTQYPRPYIKLVSSVLVETEEEVYTKHDEYIQQGYEGIIIRNVNGVYKLKHRSSDLQKYKQFLDDEFEIINYKEGEGSETGCVIWQCETPNSQTFWVRPQGTREEREVLYNDGNQYIGSKLTVRYQELTDDGIPRFPVGLCIRDYE